MAVRPKPANPPEDKVLDCAGKIVALIHDGKIVRHRRIGESSLAGTLKVSRAVMRSALEHLEIAGLVTRVPRSGTFLKEISLKEFCDVMDIRAALESLAARLAAHRIGDHEARQLIRHAAEVDALARRSAEGGTARQDLMRRDLEFHLSVATAGGNQRLASTLKQQRLIEFTFVQASDFPIHAGRSKNVPLHQEIAKAVAAHDGAQAAELMRMHILRTKESRLGNLVGELTWPSGTP